MFCSFLRQSLGSPPASASQSARTVGMYLHAQFSLKILFVIGKIILTSRSYIFFLYFLLRDFHILGLKYYPG